MGTKIICFECKEHSGYSAQKLGCCFRCGTDMIAIAGNTFRPPKKSNEKAWKQLKALLMLQRKRHGFLPGKTSYFLGWGNKAYWHGCQQKKNMPKPQKEKAAIAAIFAEYGGRA